MIDTRVVMFANEVEQSLLRFMYTNTETKRISKYVVNVVVSSNNEFIILTHYEPNNGQIGKELQEEITKHIMSFNQFAQKHSIALRDTGTIGALMQPNNPPNNG